MYNKIKGKLKLNPTATLIPGALGYRCVNSTPLPTGEQSGSLPRYLSHNFFKYVQYFHSK